MSSSSTNSSRKRRIRLSNSDSEDDDDFYSNLVDRAVDSDVDRVSSSSSSDCESSSDELALNKSDDEHLELFRNRDFEEEMKQSVLKEQLGRQKRYKKELNVMAKHGFVKEAPLGAQPRGIHVLSVYEESMKELKDVSRVVKHAKTSRDKDGMGHIDELEKPKEPEDVDFTVKMLDDDDKPTMDFTWPMKNRMQKLFEEIATRLETSVDTVKLYRNNESIEKWQTPVDLEMLPGNIYFLDCMTIGTNTKKNPTIKCQMANRRPILLTVKPETSFGEIRKMLIERGAPQFEKLVFDETVISDDKTLQDIGVEHNDVVDAM